MRDYPLYILIEYNIYMYAYCAQAVADYILRDGSGSAHQKRTASRSGITPVAVLYSRVSALWQYKTGPNRR